MFEYWEEKRINKKKIVIAVIIAILLIALITIGIIYARNKEVRVWIDKNIFRKEINQENLQKIELDEGKTPEIYAFNRYIGILNNNKFEIYNSMGKIENTLDVEITNPIFNSNNRHLVIAEEKGKKLYLITDKEIIWEKDINGNIAQISVNKNGYMAITIVDTSYKTVVAMYDNEGNELFNTYLSTTRVVSTSISNDNKYLAIAELDTSGTMVQSNIKLISIEDGKNNPENSVKKIYEGENGNLITNIKYQDKNRLICMYTDKITQIKEDGTVETIKDYNDQKITFASINLTNAVVDLEEKSTGLFTADSIVTIINTDNKNETIYSTEAVSKDIYTYNNVIAVCLGTEIDFINTSGWLIKKYKADQEINNIVLSDSVAGIIYRDRIEIVNL